MPWLLLVLTLAACAAPQHPLTYVKPSDPVWSLNPDPPSPPQTAQPQRHASAR
jgi:hypothetical protein